ncbi:MAG: ribonuclease P protein component [Tistlia sp.]|uniref:ribonuclease P protein component n=1 Tax=Tistlia sp. TaxID=3057121 RepID=UPI0034A2E8DE
MPGIERLKQRREFLTVAGQGRKWATPGLVLQALHRPEAREGLRYGLTASRKVGGAVVRNRARRRLRALAERLLPEAGRGDTDYVLIARAATVARPFDALERDLMVALERVARPRPERRGPDSRPDRRDDARTRSS